MRRYDDELTHYGILGMKWGKRRYQNKDGSLTSAGKKHYGRKDSKKKDKNRQARIRKNIKVAGQVTAATAGTAAGVAVANKLHKKYKNKDGDPTNNVESMKKMATTQKIIKESSSAVNALKRMEKESAPKPVKERMDLSSKSNKELQEAINRETLELRYNDLFSKPAPVQISAGRQFTRDVLDVAGDLLPIAGSSLSIALAVKALRGK